MKMSLQEASEIVLSAWPDGNIKPAMEDLRRALEFHKLQSNSSQTTLNSPIYPTEKIGIETSFVESMGDLEWLILDNESGNGFTNYGDARSGDASYVVLYVNAKPDLGFGYTDWRLPTIAELACIQAKTTDLKINFFHSSEQPSSGILRRLAMDYRWGNTITVPAYARGLLRLVRRR